MPLSWEQIKESVKGKNLQKEQFKRHNYARWFEIILKRRDEGACVNCGELKWIQRGTGFQRHWVCDGCGFIAYYKDFYKDNMYFDRLYYLGRQEKKRIKRARKDKDIKTYEKDDIHNYEKDDI